MPKQYNSIFSETSDTYEIKIDKNIIFSTLKIRSVEFYHHFLRKNEILTFGQNWRLIHLQLVWNPSHDEVYSIQHYVIKFVCDLRQVCGFLRVLQFPPLIELTATI